ncbi:hypothetical protein B0T10DRAFT_533442 [Thelonectria olida]|uniref:Ferric reductase NAD binding domain-containing protein n=1 Tax=Thelonectria olida TaxID=1576542 RepID=A0A9P9AIX9_9HYPO|nr:hypothetical protein B0T10DRAFT_533442 [Thelonectria olida]
MESTLWYLIALSGFFLVSFCLWTLKFFVPNVTRLYIRYLKYPLIIRRRRYWDSVTYAEFWLLMALLVTNILLIVTPSGKVDWKQVVRRSAFASGVNMVPLCLGGRMGHIVQTFNIHRSSYKFFHHWLGRIAILEAMVHAIISIRTQSQHNSLTTSGWIVSMVEMDGDSGMLKIEVALRFPIKVPPGTYFNIFFPGTVSSYHLLHSYPAVAFWHPPDTTDPSGMVSNISFLLTRRGSHARSLLNIERGQKILLDGPFGQDLGLESYENVIFLAKGVGIAGVLPLVLQLTERWGHDNGVRTKLQQLSKKIQILSMKERDATGTERDEIIQKKGALMVEKESLSRESLFRDATKKIVLFWSLEHNSQMEAVGRYLKRLQELDPDNKLLVVWCGYPCQRSGSLPFDLKSNFWACMEPSPGRPEFDTFIISKIAEERQRLQGRMMVTTCGSARFTTRIRKVVLDIIDEMAVEFTETEFRPLGTNIPTRDGVQEFRAYLGIVEGALPTLPGRVEEVSTLLYRCRVE